MGPMDARAALFPDRDPFGPPWGVGDGDGLVEGGLRLIVDDIYQEMIWI